MNGLGSRGRLIAATIVACVLCGTGGRVTASPGPMTIPKENAGAQPPGAVVGDDPFTVQVVTFGPGGHPFTKFGHNAIRIVDRRMNTDVVYNFGTFSFDSPRLIVDFLRGRLRYWLSMSTTAATAFAYRRENRTIEIQELNLSPDQKRELSLRLEANARLENREYRYDYFRDNCSTRVRDALDGVMHGRLRPSALGPGVMSLRAHALRMAADNLPLYLALMIVLGPSTDRPIDQWGEAFLPEMLQRNLRAAPADADARAGSLVKTERILFSSSRPAVAREPPSRGLIFFAAGVLAGLIVFLGGRLGSRFSAARFLFGILVSAVGLVAGGIGCFLLGSWALTPHEVVYRNQNILLFAPFSVVFVVLGLGSAFGRRGAMRKVFVVSACALGFAGVACALKLLPWGRQENGALILFMMPFWFGLTAGARSITTNAPPVAVSGR